ncbi:Tup N-terminal-domain-containing protein [Amanita rubescens]|nr:Tup N-terminal-domain-containing protein [Amanita rubescens]
MTTSQVYSHRSLQPTSGRPPRMHASHARIQDSFDIIRQEMESTTVELEKLRAQRDDYESQVNTQVHELGILRRSFYDLETQHVQLRKQYEEEVHRLRSEISRFRGTRPISRSGSLLNVAPNSNIPSDSRDIGRDRVEREQRIQMPPLFGRVMEPERDMDRLTDHRNAKRLKSRPDQTEDSPIRMESPPKQVTINAMGPPGLMTSTSPKSAVTPHSDCPTGIGPNQFQEVQNNDGNWSVVHNSKVPKVLDVSLLHTFTHGSVVCCVQFSPDGKYVATGCNRSARVYDAKTGLQKCCLVDDSVAGMAGDLYIRSVRFSPDGKYLATGAEDRKIRVSIINFFVRTCFPASISLVFFAS